MSGVAMPARLPGVGLDGLRYGSLGFALAFLSLPLYVLLPSHYAAQHGVTLSALGLVLLATRALDAMLDPFIGRAMDSLFAHSLPWALRVAALAASLLAAGFTALFAWRIPEGWTLPWLVLGLLVTYLAFSVLTIAHQAWGVRLGGDAPQRARLVAWREGCGSVGLLVGSMLPSVAGWPATCMVLAASLALGMAGLARASRPPVGQASEPWPWTQPWRDPGFRQLLAVFMCNGIASAVPATLVVFFVTDRLQAPQWLPAYLGAYFVSAIVSVPAWLGLTRRLGLARSWLGGMGLAITSFVFAGALGAADQAAFFAVCMASGAALGADLTIPGALLAGVVQRGGAAGLADGVYVGWWNTVTKLNLGLAAGAALPLLAVVGYLPGQRDEPALRALTLAYVLVPCALKLVAALWLWQGWIRKGASE
jgi:Na+/melibiose symporter-like transporter